MRPIWLGLIAPLLLVACAPAALSVRNNKSSSDLTGVGFSTGGWKTDFSRHSVPLSEITSGGPPRDGIPPLDHPRFVSPATAQAWLKGREPVAALEVNGDDRAYPLEILIRHEIVNDQAGGVPVTVTCCPLCHTAVAFDRRVNGQVLDFRTTGNLRRSDLVMWDRQTESWWRQATGTAIVGSLTGTVLNVLPASIVSFDAFRLAYPSGQVLSRDTGFSRTYGENPYPGYDDVNNPPFLFSGSVDGRLAPKDRVVTVSLNGESVAYPHSALRKRGVVEDTVAGTPIAVFYRPGTASALGGSSIPDNEDVGATGVFKAQLGDRTLTFHPDSTGFVDDQTGSHWDLLGRALSGPLSGSRLEPVVHGDYFWFAWAAFQPQTRIYR